MSQNIQFNKSAINAGDCISQGWEAIKSQYWLFFGVAFLAFVITACIPCLNIFLVGPVMAGIFILHFTLFRRQPVDFGMMFKGFEKFVPAMVIGLIQAIPGVVMQGVQYTADLGNVAKEILRQKGIGNTNFLAQSSSPDLAISGGIIAIALVVGLVFFLLMIAWNITFYFAIPIIADKDCSIGEAISLSAKAGWGNVGGIIVLALLQGLVGIAGALACGIGIFFVLPILYASAAMAYRQVFPDTPQPQYNTPPQPNAYGGGYGQPM